MEIANHVFFAIFPVVLYSLVRYHRFTDGLILFVALFASLFPDLVDKPLAWTLGVIPSGRMFAHSLVVASVIIVCVMIVTYQNQQSKYGVVFTWGYVSHLIGDFYHVFSKGLDYYYFPNMLWPIMEPSPARNPGFAGKIPELGISTIIFVILVLYIATDIRRRVVRGSRTS
ncbi:metal-dependent hydrolase [Halovenus sp. HT40]|uniref:metal-dependent hydrolase n=1 Tax=Halovenus sp. HT40 TaxID=3126691 RepID=UPI00300F0A7D